MVILKPKSEGNTILVDSKEVLELARIISGLALNKGIGLETKLAGQLAMQSFWQKVKEVYGIEPEGSDWYWTYNSKHKVLIRKNK